MRKRSSRKQRELDNETVTEVKHQMSGRKKQRRRAWKKSESAKDQSHGGIDRVVLQDREEREKRGEVSGTDVARDSKRRKDKRRSDKRRLEWGEKGREQKMRVERKSE